MKCFDLNPYNISIFGDNDPSNLQGNLVFNINQCVNSTSNKNNCLPQNEIDKRLRETKLSLSYENNDVNTGLENPFIKYTNGKIYRFTNTLKTKYFLELDTLEFISDEGLIFEEYVTYNSYQIGEATIMQNLGLGASLYPGSFGSVGFYASGRKKIYQRSYLKFHSIFPYLIGIYQILLFLFKFLTIYFDGGRLNNFLFSRIIEEKEYGKFKRVNRPLLYDDLFKNIPISNKNENEKENEKENDVLNSISNENENQRKNIEADSSISDPINQIQKIHKTNNYSSSSQFQRDKKKENNNLSISIKKKEKDRNIKNMRNNFFPNHEKTEHEKEKENNYHRVDSLKKSFNGKENDIENYNNSKGFVIKKKNIESINVKREINKDKK